MKLLILLLFVAINSFEIKSQIIEDGKCVDVPAFNIDLDKIVGEWFRYKFYQNPIDKDIRCSKDILKHADGTVSGTIKGINTLSNKIWKIQFKAVRNVDNSFNLIYDGDDTKMLVKVIDMIDDDYFAVWSCQEQPNNKKIEYLWIYTKRNKLTDDSEKKMMDVLAKYKLNSSDLIKADQDNCDVFN